MGRRHRGGAALKSAAFAMGNSGDSTSSAASSTAAAAGSGSGTQVAANGSGGRTAAHHNKTVTFDRRAKKSSSSSISKSVANGSGSYYLPPAGKGLKPSPSLATLNRLDRQAIVLWRRPITTMLYFVMELAYKIVEAIEWLLSRWPTVLVATVATALGALAYNTPGPHQPYLELGERTAFWCVYWLGLGVLSSIGLGTGLHTFLLYLGPHIAAVTLAAYECDTLAFPQPPYPDQIQCPDTPASGAQAAGAVTSVAVSLWAIMGKVRLETFMWGAGTALGELPPYFMARAARLSDEEPDDPEYREFIDFLAARDGPQEEASSWNRAKIWIEKLVEGAGFFGILLCASIPNPLFDLAGITCGHFLVPFWTFFGATLVGKAVVKMHIQKLFVILAFSEHHIETLINLMEDIPYVGQQLQAPFLEYMEKQKLKLHAPNAHNIKSSLLAEAFALLVAGMVLYFVLSIVNSLAQSYHRRLWEAQKRQASQKKFH